MGDAGVRANAQQDKIFVGMILILIFGEALALYGLIVSLILTSQGWKVEKIEKLLIHHKFMFLALMDVLEKKYKQEWREECAIGKRMNMDELDKRHT